VARRRCGAGAAETARLLARRDYVAAEQAAARLRDQTEPGPSGLPAGWRPARHFAVSVEQVVALARETGTPPQIEIDGDFVPAVTLAMGNLPGSPAVARGVAPRAGRWNPLARLDFTTRQAVQVAVAGTLAIVLGRQLDTTRYYWAVIAAFVAFTGTGTRSEAFLKAFNRVLGTLVGLAGGIWLAGLTAGHTPWILVVIVASMFCGFYLMRLSYAYMIFFITIMVAQLYSVLNELSDHLLVLRLEETGIGAAAGIAVALLVAPLSTRDTVAAAQSTLLDDARRAARRRRGPLPAGGCAPRRHRAPGPGCALAWSGQPAPGASSGRSPLTRPLLWDNSPRKTRHRLTVYAACVRSAMSVAAALRDPAALQPGFVTACLALADAARTLAENPGPPGRRADEPDPAARQALDRADAALFAADTSADSAAVASARRALIHLQALLRELVGSDGRSSAPSSAQAMAVTAPR